MLAVHGCFWTSFFQARVTASTPSDEAVQYQPIVFACADGADEGGAGGGDDAHPFGHEPRAAIDALRHDRRRSTRRTSARRRTSFAGDDVPDALGVGASRDPALAPPRQSACHARRATLVAQLDPVIRAQNRTSIAAANEHRGGAPDRGDGGAPDLGDGGSSDAGGGTDDDESDDETDDYHDHDADDADDDADRTARRRKRLQSAAPARRHVRYASISLSKVSADCATTRQRKAAVRIQRHFRSRQLRSRFRKFVLFARAVDVRRWRLLLFVRIWRKVGERENEDVCVCPASEGSLRSHPTREHPPTVTRTRLPGFAKQRRAADHAKAFLMAFARDGARARAIMRRFVRRIRICQVRNDVAYKGCPL